MRQKDIVIGLVLLIILSAEIKVPDFLDRKLFEENLDRVVKAELVHNFSSSVGEQGEVDLFVAEKISGPNGT